MQCNKDRGRWERNQNQWKEEEEEKGKTNSVKERRWLWEGKRETRGNMNLEMGNCHIEDDWGEGRRRSRWTLPYRPSRSQLGLSWTVSSSPPSSYICTFPLTLPPQPTPPRFPIPPFLPFSDHRSSKSFLQLKKKIYMMAFPGQRKHHVFGIFHCTIHEIVNAKLLK